MRNWSVLMVVAAVAAAVAVALSGGAGTADAYPKRVCEGGKCKTVCRQDLANGNSVDYDEGTTITVNLQNGTKQTFKCKNGEWVRVRLIVGGSTFEFPKRK